MNGKESLSTKELLTVKEVAEAFGTNSNYIYSLIKQGLLPALKLGSYKVRRVAMQQFLETYEGFDLTNPASITELKVMQR